ncbi:hypothetical protein HNR40_008805 [Nonomuraea endophytica]|uniref:K(+)-transporting ATPase subunit F n=1 Tax=Nonomuraea endophytica TaxID=714136 RepID=A0A7W8ABW0_9ACTN|nr:hypothetical protein [Nonomuraea endophytica]
MSLENLVGLLIVVALLAYLLLAIRHPGKF